MNLRIDVYHHMTETGQSDYQALRDILNSVNQKLQTMANSIDDLSAQVDALQVSLDEKQAALEASNTQKAQTIDELQVALDLANAMLIDGGTAEQRQAVADKLTAIKADLESTPV